MGDAIRVLHVDADPDIARRTATSLESETDRIAVDTAASADEALDDIAEQEYDCIVSEYELRGTDGVEFLRAVRDEYTALPFVLFTDGGSEAVASEAISAGVTDYVRKEAGTDQYERLVAAIDEAVSTGPVELSNVEIDGEFGGQRSLLRNVVEQIPTHMYVKDREARHLWVSGYDVNCDDSIPDSEEHIGKTDRELYPDELSRESYEDDRRVIETGEPLIGKVEYEPAADEWILSNKVPWYDENGEIAGLIGVTRRITERKKYEQRLERQNERLDEFVSLVSHDLRSPLTVADAYVELAREACDCPHLDEVAGALDRMDTLIEELLTLAREGKQAVEPCPVSLPTFAERCWDDVATADATLAVETDRVIRADDGRLRQLFEILFRNAVEHASTSPRSQAPEDAAGVPSSDEPSVTEAPEDAAEHGDGVTVTVGELDDVSASEATGGGTDESVAGFYVEDDGPGIPEDERETVFERGYSTTETGTGYGLSIAQTVAETHGWEIDVTDGEDGGARFRITGVEFVE